MWNFCPLSRQWEEFYKHCQGAYEDIGSKILPSCCSRSALLLWKTTLCWNACLPVNQHRDVRIYLAVISLISNVWVPLMRAWRQGTFVDMKRSPAGPCLCCNTNNSVVNCFCVFKLHNICPYSTVQITWHLKLALCKLLNQGMQPVSRAHCGAVTQTSITLFTPVSPHQNTSSTVTLQHMEWHCNYIHINHFPSLSSWLFFEPNLRKTTRSGNSKYRLTQSIWGAHSS